ncbi:MAG TPA: hypothetical protein QGF58_24205 [Myxococcota bacterium]|nr:hypothetical protein [Myxococcota bacterium]
MLSRPVEEAFIEAAELLVEVAAGLLDRLGQVEVDVGSSSVSK